MPSRAGFGGSTKGNSGLGMLWKEPPGPVACCSFRVMRKETQDQ